VSKHLSFSILPPKLRIAQFLATVTCQFDRLYLSTNDVIVCLDVPMDMKRRKGFTLVELMVVVLIVGILAAVTVPLLRGRIDKAKWVEANATAGALKTAVRAYVATSDPNSASFSEIEGSLANSSVASALGFTGTSLNGSYFNQADYTISNVDGATGTCVITVTSTHPEGPPGTGILAADGTWSVTTDGGARGGSGDDGGLVGEAESGGGRRVGGGTPSGGWRDEDGSGDGLSGGGRRGGG
jgi:type IV pilus assembly protein PilA